MQIIVGGIIEKEGKILMVQEAKKICYGKWSFPAGHLEDGETIFDGAIREIHEETGCKVKLTKLLPIINRKLNNEMFIMIIFAAELLEEKIKFEPKEILEVKWIKKEEIENMSNNELRDEKLMKNIIKTLKENKLYPLDIIQNEI